MSPNDISYSDGFFKFASSESSDSDSFLEQDIKNCDSPLNKQWEAIERTLYQEDGQKISDPELLKECKLWRDTFPHIRVKGTKIDNPNPRRRDEEDDDDQEDSNKIVQTSTNFDLKKLDEKQKAIKNKVVDALVERIMNKLSLNMEKISPEKGVEITELEEDEEVEFEKLKSSASISEKESYYERGKSPEVSTKKKEEKAFEVLEKWSVEDATPKRTVEKQERPSPISNYPDGLTKKPEKRIPSSDAIMKPFELTKKIDKKYEGLLDRIVERRFSELEPVSSLQEIKSYRESIQKMKMNCGIGSSTRNRNLRKLNKFGNNWLDRSEIHEYQNKISTNKQPASVHRTPEGDCKGEMMQEDLDDEFINDLRREMAKGYRRPSKKSAVVEEFGWRKAQTCQEFPEQTQKSFSCGDLMKRNAKMMKSKPSAVQSIVKTRAKTTNMNTSVTKNIPSNKTKSKNGLLPPIETSIICTELKITPKGGTRQTHKKYY